MGGAGIGMRHTKFTHDKNWIFRHENCRHIKNSLNKNQPIFYVKITKFVAMSALTILK